MLPGGDSERLATQPPDTGQATTVVGSAIAGFELREVQVCLLACIHISRANLPAYQSLARSHEIEALTLAHNSTREAQPSSICDQRVFSPRAGEIGHCDHQQYTHEDGNETSPVVGFLVLGIFTELIGMIFLRKQRFALS